MLFIVLPDCYSRVAFLLGPVLASWAAVGVSLRQHVTGTDLGAVVPHFAYWANRPAILIAAINHGIKPNASEIARAVGLNRNTIMELLAGKRPASAATLAAISQYFGGPPEQYFDLLAGDVVPVPHDPTDERVSNAKG